MQNAISLKEHLDNLQALIDAHGWAFQVVDSDPTLCYTVGLQKRGVPEIVLMGLPPEVAQQVLAVVVPQLMSKELVLKENLRYNEVFDGFQAKFSKLKLTQVSEYLPVANILADCYVEAWQLLWPDEEGRFPGDAGVSSAYAESQDLEILD